MLVEDDPTESRLYKTLFIKEGFEVMAIENGQDCRQSALDFKPDVILLDVMMPKTNGFEVLDILKFHPETQIYPVIMLTNLSDQHFVDEALSHGATKFIVKSNIDNKNLIQTVRDVIGAYASQK
ncbi:hypothetical protein A2Z00_03675 [Candidatus Gottesmanbacteria bacterium RBG_13_45_10]|uniref:Response regulatory domain-containing protein n=1 Tax=Candidatus Gottesmanbacteria bacterium RBG_13_45_10 TaxID=1798370 RepID=A0A1F5ZHY6_9BACT|nr:MAG: hypothetical protein A2Z00_03675 [Candidatus Gottesmanbacteria bacterium RBG_13_45_10]